MVPSLQKTNWQKNIQIKEPEIYQQLELSAQEKTIIERIKCASTLEHDVLRMGDRYGRLQSFKNPKCILHHHVGPSHW